MRNYGYDEAGHTGSLSDLELWKKILRITSAYKYGLAGAVLLSFFITFATLSLPYLIQTGIDSFMMAKELPLTERLAGISNTTILYGTFVIALFIGGFGQIILLEWIGQSVMHSIRQTLFHKIVHLDLPFFSEQPTGRLVTRLTNDIQNMHEMFTSVIVSLFNDSLRLIGILGLLIWMNNKLGLLMCLFLPLSLILTTIFSKFARVKFRAMRNGVAKINTYLNEAISGAATIQIFGKEKLILERFRKINIEYQGHSLGQVKVFGAFMPLTEFLSSFAVALILWHGGGQVIQNKMSLGELVAFLSYMRLFFQPLRELSQKYSIVQAAMASAERIFELLDTKQSIMERQHNTVDTTQSPVRGKIIFDKVHFGYSKESQILHNINLHIEQGETIALVGTTGAGKTSLINLLLRFYEPEQGSVSIDDNNVADFRIKELRSVVGVILQDIILLQDTLLANIVMNTGKSREEVESILQATSMDRFIKKLPKGLDTLVGQGGQELSTGEKQLLSFARVLCRDPKIIVLDEATAAIDTESENILEEALEQAFYGRTSLIIAHRLSTIRRADRIIVMAHGRIIEEGTHDELIAKEGRYFELSTMDQEQLHVPAYSA